ncbi:MAG: tetratricopeptide repeat protein [Myxococcota bacterium]|nr:tetratricopeptide repeat protein [Myxococcota bacterium]
MRNQNNFRAVTTALSMALLGLTACGGGKASTGLKAGGGVPPPPPVSSGTDSGPTEPKREFSKDAKKDFEAAYAGFATNDKGGSWNESACRGSADRFASVVRQHAGLVEAQFMVGLSYHRCNLVEDAEKAYQAALRMKPNHGQSLSNLGQIYYKAGKADGAKQYWDSAIKANGKLVAARINTASMELDQMRKVGERDPKWKSLEEDAKFQLSSALGVESDNVEAYTVYGLIYMEGWKKNKNRLDLAKLLLDEAKKRNEKFAPLQNAYGLYYLHRNALSEALTHFQAAVELDPRFVQARLNVGLITLGFRKYDTAKEQFSKVIELQPKEYDAYIGMGAALRGLKDLDGAEAQYKKAQQIDSRRGDALYNLGVLYKDFRATKQEAQASIATYKQAKEFFRQFLDKTGEESDKAEAKEQVALIDKTVTQTEKFLKMMASQPQQPAAPTPAPPAKK